VDIRDADRPVNPASVVKIATTLWAFERLGPDHRFTTRIGIREATREPEGPAVAGTVEGDLVVLGGDDPDFHVENAYLVARALEGQGVREVTGSLLVDERFSIGWEGGVAGEDPVARARTMAERLRDALDPERHDPAMRRAIDDLRRRRGWSATPRPRIVVHGGVGLLAEGPPPPTLVLHRSNPLPRTLKRLNAYSNNDIERLGRVLGTAADLGALLGQRLEIAPPPLGSLSGLGTSRMSCREVVRLLLTLDETCRSTGIGIEAVLPVAGCDPGTLERFPRLAASELRGAIVAKTGTLKETDGGVAVLAGLARTADGDRRFCIATTGTGAAVQAARAAQEAWLVEVVRSAGGARPRACPAEVGYSDAEAAVEIIPPSPAR
jgi:D-alanyl-D-alanine carboxypeptidase/D-alanyl-D-alanine-endopeptidase (penicillin-binding protein 4)